MSRRILFQLSGSIAAYKSCFAISRLVQDGFEVRVACTPNALRFVGAATLEGLTGQPVFSDAYDPGRMMDHIHLARWAELSILAPASASTLNRLAAGLGDDAVGSLFLAHDLRRQPYWVAPAMNHQMWAHPATQASVARLREWGVRVLEPGEGHQACGETGAGRMMEPEAILAAVKEWAEITGLRAGAPTLARESGPSARGGEGR